LIEFALSALAAIFVVMDPLGAIPIFLGVTQGYTTERRNAIVKKACLAAFLILLGFALLGGLIFKIFGITLAAFRVAGGILFLKIAFDMLYGKMPETHLTSGEEKEAIEKEEVAIVPLAMPLLSGPATIATVLVLMEKAQSLFYSFFVILAVLISCISSYIILRSSDWLFHKLGQTGLKIFVRIMGLILLALAVQFILEGIKEMFFK
jgi:multiple antibiotic resistance protein